MAANLIDLVAQHTINPSTEADILLSILPQDLGGGQKLIIYRERLRNLKEFFVSRGDSRRVGRALWRLADIEKQLQNFAEMRKIALQAAPYAEYIPMPMRISFHSDLGFYLLENDNPETGLDHFITAYELASVVNRMQQAMIIMVLEAILPGVRHALDEDYVRKRMQTLVSVSLDQQLKQRSERLLESIRNKKE